jgi:hypothetical protein
MPTPPPEKPAKPERSRTKEHSRSHKEKEESRTTKKERPKVVRDQGSQSWGFWGAQAPPAKSSSRSKPSSPVKERPSGVSRSKSARKSAEKDHLEKASKSSGSEEGKGRPSTSRGMSFSGMFGGKGAAPPPPSRSKSTRQPSSRDAPRPSRRHSTAVDDNGMISPPPEDSGANNVAAKAAKVMGFTGRSGTLKEKKRRVPDPYAIDSDDMVMVDAPNVDEPPRERREHKTRRNKRDSAYMSGALGNEEPVMVDAPRDEARVTSGPDDIAFVDRPSAMKRGDSIRKGGLIGGILGAFAGAGKANAEKRQSRAYESDYDASRRKRGPAYDDDPSKRLRREDRRLHRSQRSADGETYPDGGMTDAEDPAAREARRAERRERRERILAEDPERAARHEARRRAERERLAQEDEDQRRRDERRARHAERDSRRPEDDRHAQDDEARNEERRERRRQREQQRMDEEAAAARPRTERRRSHAPEDDEARRARHEERRMRHSMAEAAAEKERPRHSRRRSERPAPVEGYFDRRNGEQDGAPLPYDDADGAPPFAVKTGKDKTASWVHSISDAPPPPIEATIIDAPVHFAADNTPDAMMMDEDLTARELRHSRRKAKDRHHRDLDGYSTEDPEMRRRKRQDAAAAGGPRGGRPGMGGPVNSMGYDSMDGVKTFDGRPAPPIRGESKAGSWLKKITGL